MLTATAASSVRARLDRLARRSAVLRRIREDQERLVPGIVCPEEAWARLSVANHINEACQRLELELVAVGVHQEWAPHLAPIRTLAETVLRENAVLQARSPLHVIRAADMPSRFVLNRMGGRERRIGFGLHRRGRNEEGPSVVVAFTPPAYEQMWHAHTVDEYTLALDVRFAGKYADEGVRHLEACDGQLFHFHPHTYHTLVNRDARTGRTLTLKYPMGISVWLPAFSLTGSERGAAEVWSPAVKHLGGHAVREFEICDPHHTYRIAVIHLYIGDRLAIPCADDTYLYVLDGRVAVQRDRRSVIAEADDVIVAEPSRTLRLRALTARVRLYRPYALPAVPLRHNGIPHRSVRRLEGHTPRRVTPVRDPSHAVPLR
ncbi:MAG: hypothetical protein QN123_11165 [Armatimonadota bacterium]|nr:hypothetical protein [Armatimonadota bacterium]